MTEALDGDLPGRADPLIAPLGEAAKTAPILWRVLEGAITRVAGALPGVSGSAES